MYVKIATASLRQLLNGVFADIVYASFGEDEIRIFFRTVDRSVVAETIQVGNLLEGYQFVKEDGDEVPTFDVVFSRSAIGPLLSESKVLQFSSDFSAQVADEGTYKAHVTISTPSIYQTKTKKGMIMINSIQGVLDKRRPVLEQAGFEANGDFCVTIQLSAGAFAKTLRRGSFASSTTDFEFEPNGSGEIKVTISSDIGVKSSEETMTGVIAAGEVEKFKEQFSASLIKNVLNFIPSKELLIKITPDKRVLLFESVSSEKSGQTRKALVSRLLAVKLTTQAPEAG
jgi:hypothetical protein